MINSFREQVYLYFQLRVVEMFLPFDVVFGYLLVSLVSFRDRDRTSTWQMTVLSVLPLRRRGGGITGQVETNYFTFFYSLIGFLPTKKF